ncbi:MAG: hypothetical protein H6574_25220 [Lewinellaceae bacterium]|nr:hypothetical protein [Lewinellaceae bacterium]
MKRLSIILGLYILALATLPCADEAGWCVFDLEESFGIELHETGNHNHENECSDHCSPLCICSCCQMTLKTPVKFVLAITVLRPLFSDLPSFEPVLKDLNPIDDVWQPPKFC